MARLLGPDANSRLVYSVVGPRLASQVAATATVYADAAGTVLADIRTYDGTQTPGAAIAGATLTVDGFSLLPFFWFPDSVDTVYVKVGTAPPAKVNADYDARLDALAANTARTRGAWTPTTLYLAGDVVSYFGDMFIVTTGHTSGASFSLANLTILNQPPHVFKPEWYGAKGDDWYVTDGAMTAASAALTSATANFTAADVGKPIQVRGAAAGGNVLLTTISAYVSPTQVTLTVAATTTVSAAYLSWGTDDTAAINAAVNAATNWMATHGEGKVKFRNAWYAVAGPLIQGGATKTNTQIPLPIVATTGNSPMLELEGSGTADNISHWQQTVGQRAGTVLHSYVTGTNHGTFGEASVIGGPTPQQGYGSNTSVFSNVEVHIDQIEVLVANTANGSDICGVDLRGVGKYHIGTLACLVDAGAANIITGKGSGWAFGFAGSNPANNAKLTIDSYSCEGFTYGLAATEHLAAQNVLAVYCFTGILIVGSFFNSSGAQHVAWIGSATVEACVNAVQWVGGGKAVIDVLTVEGSFTGGMHVADTNGTGTGQVNLGGIINTIQVSDPTNVRVIYIDGTSGNAAAPAMPASATALRNPFWRDCAVTITGGTVTAITVDGVATGLTSGTVIVPSGRKIAITYSVAPTWVWIKL